jgi:toxin ParE1/3/4
MARVVFTAADADAAFVLDDLHIKAGKPSVVKYRASFKMLHKHLADFPNSGAPRPKMGSNIRIGSAFPTVVIYRHAEAPWILWGEWRGVMCAWVRCISRHLRS